MDKIYEITSALSSSSPLEEKFKLVNEIANAWFVVLQTGKPYKDNPADVTAAQRSIQKFVYSWHGFASRGIPFALWKEIAEEGLAILKEMIESGDFKYEEKPRYKELMGRVHARWKEILAMPEYADPYGDRFGMGN